MAKQPRKPGAGNEEKITVTNTRGVDMKVAPDSAAAPDFPPKN